MTRTLRQIRADYDTAREAVVDTLIELRMRRRTVERLRVELHRSKSRQLCAATTKPKTKRQT